MAKNDRLTPLQEAFCREWIIDKRNGEAAIRAGYRGNPTSASIQAYKWLKMPKIQARLAKLCEASSIRLNISADEVVAEISKRAFADPIRLYEAVKAGGISAIPKDLRSLVKGIVPTQWGEKIILCDKDANMKLLAEHFNIFESHQKAGATVVPAFDHLVMDEAQKRLKGDD